MKINARNKKKDFKDASTNRKKMTEKRKEKWMNTISAFHPLKRKGGLKCSQAD